MVVSKYNDLLITWLKILIKVISLRSRPPRLSESADGHAQLEYWPALVRLIENNYRLL